MSTIDSSHNASNALSQYSIQKQQQSSNASKSAGSSTTGSGVGSLSSNEFMKLMITQLKNQDPTNPQDSAQMLSQLAQFSSLQEMQGVSTSMDNLATQYRSSQALQASAIIGRSVVVPSSTASLGASRSVSGYVDLSQSTGDLKVSILDGSGQVVRQLDLGAQGAGQVPFQWNGEDASGNALPVGTYSLQANADTGSGNAQQQTSVSANVDSVSLGSGGSLTLNVAGMGSVPMSKVTQID